MGLYACLCVCVRVKERETERERERKRKKRRKNRQVTKKAGSNLKRQTNTFSKLSLT